MTLIECSKGGPIYFLLYSFLMGMTFATIMGDECDWTGSGLDLSISPKEAGITPIYLRCSAGKIVWTYPRRALRLIFKLPEDRNFFACIKYTSTEVPGQPVTKMYLERPLKILPLYRNDDKVKPTKCFTSINRQAAIFIEALNDPSLVKHTIQIEYDLQKLRKNATNYDPNDECRPCTTQEMSRSFCSSDVVVQGSIRSIDNNDIRKVTQLTIKVGKMIRSIPTNQFVREIESNMISNSIEHHLKEKVMTINIPEICGASEGLGEFVFMARQKLGELSLLCAPRLEKWTQLVEKLNKSIPPPYCFLRS